MTANHEALINSLEAQIKAEEAALLRSREALVAAVGNVVYEALNISKGDRVKMDTGSLEWVVGEPCEGGVWFHGKGRSGRTITLSEVEKGTFQNRFIKLEAL